MGNSIPDRVNATMRQFKASRYLRFPMTTPQARGDFASNPTSTTGDKALHFRTVTLYPCASWLACAATKPEENYGHDKHYDHELHRRTRLILEVKSCCLACSLPSSTLLMQLEREPGGQGPREPGSQGARYGSCMPQTWIRKLSPF